MKRIRCKTPQAATNAKCGSNVKDGKHRRAAAKRLARPK